MRTHITVVALLLAVSNAQDTTVTAGSLLKQARTTLTAVATNAKANIETTAASLLPKPMPPTEGSMPPPPGSDKSSLPPLPLDVLRENGLPVPGDKPEDMPLPPGSDQSSLPPMKFDENGIPIDPAEAEAEVTNATEDDEERTKMLEDMYADWNSKNHTNPKGDDEFPMVISPPPMFDFENDTDVPSNKSKVYSVIESFLEYFDYIDEFKQSIIQLKDDYDQTGNVRLHFCEAGCSDEIAGAEPTCCATINVYENNHQDNSLTVLTHCVPSILIKSATGFNIGKDYFEVSCQSGAAGLAVGMATLLVASSLY